MNMTPHHPIIVTDGRFKGMTGEVIKSHETNPALVVCVLIRDNGGAVRFSVPREHVLSRFTPKAGLYEEGFRSGIL